MPPGSLTTNWDRTTGQTQNLLERLHISSGKRLGILQEELESVSRERDVCKTLDQSMDGWMDGWSLRC